MNDWIGKFVSFFKDNIPKEEPAIRGKQTTLKGRLMRATKKTPVFGVPAYECEVKGNSGTVVKVCSVGQYLRLCEDNPKEKMTRKEFKKFMKDDNK